MQSKKLIFSIFIFLILFSLPFIHIVSNPNLWNYNIGNVENKEELITNVNNFLEGREELKYFDEDVKEHFKDVRALYWYSKIVLITMLALSLVLAFFMKRKEIVSATRTACGALISLWIVLGLWSVISFNTFFDAFHSSLFSGNYSFSPNNLVIQLFTQEFFFGIGMFIALTELVLSLIIIRLLKD